MTKEIRRTNTSGRPAVQILSFGFRHSLVIRHSPSPMRRLERRTNWSQIVEAVEASKGESWEQFHLRHDDWGRDAVLWLGRKVGRLSLRELGKSAGMDYPAVSQAVVRFAKRIERDTTLRRLLTKIRHAMLNV